MIALQEMNLAFKYPTIFWNCACLITDGGGAEISVDKNNNYDKIASAIGKMQSEGIQIIPPDINSSSYTFSADVEGNKILFGLRGLLNVGDELIAEIISKRPYSSPRDFVNRVNVKKNSMISLIKAGAFDKMMDRKLCMGWYLWQICDKKQRLTLQNMGALIKYGLIPKELEYEESVYEFNRYLKTINYILDERATKFIENNGLFEYTQPDANGNLSVIVKNWEKYYKTKMDTVRTWLAKDKVDILQKLNSIIFKKAWDKDASGTISAWEMEVMCFYYHEHELANLNREKYGISAFAYLPEEPVVDYSIKRGNSTFNVLKLTKIAGTCIAKDKAKATVTLLTPSGVANLKMPKEYFNLFDRQISKKNPDGTKTIIERSWFNRGSMIMAQGYRTGDIFRLKKYNSSGASHQLYKIDAIDDKGELVLRTERKQGEYEDNE